MNNNLDKNEFKSIENFLIQNDFNSASSKEFIYNKLKFKIENKKLNYDSLKNENKFLKSSKIATITFSILIIGFTAAYATGAISSIISYFEIGNTNITQYSFEKKSEITKNNSEISMEDMQKGFKGKLFDKNGKEVLYGSSQDYYTSDGIIITEMGVKDLENGKHEFFIGTTQDNSFDKKYLTLKEIKELSDSKIKFFDFLPYEYKFSKAYSNKNGNDISITYEDASGNSITLLASTLKIGSSFIATTEKIKEQYIDSKKIIFSANCAVWEENNATYQFFWNFIDDDKKMDESKVIEIIKSMK